MEIVIDTLTILKARTPVRKSFSGSNFRQKPIQVPRLFDVTTARVNDLSDLAEALFSIEKQSSKAVIRGVLREQVTQFFQLPRTNEIFQPAPRQWCMLDIDGLDWDGPLSDTNRILKNVIEHLPIEFQRINFWYQFSSSMGIKPGIRVHLWFWLERACSDFEMKTLLRGCPIDLGIFNPVQIHLTASPNFIDGAVDPISKRSGLFDAGKGLDTVQVPIDLKTRAIQTQKMIQPRSRTRSGSLDPQGIVRDPKTGLAVDGREQLLFLLSNEVACSLASSNHTPNEAELTSAIWQRFCEEADLNVISERGEWTISDARKKAKARLKEIKNNVFSFVSRSPRTTVVAGSPETIWPELLTPQRAEKELRSILSGFFDDLTVKAAPRVAIRLTMGAGKTKQTIEHLKLHLKGQQNRTVEIYVPRHDLADEWERLLVGADANVIHVYPRTGGQRANSIKDYAYPILCERADYVRDLERKGYGVYGNACLSRTSSEQCGLFSSCRYLDQFRQEGARNTVRIYTHASLFLRRNEYERRYLPDLVIIDESFISAATSNLAAVSARDVVRFLSSTANTALGCDLVECLSQHGGDLEWLRGRGITASNFDDKIVSSLRPPQTFDPTESRDQNLPSANLYKNLVRIIELAAHELSSEGPRQFSKLSFDIESQRVVICEHRTTRVPNATSVLYLDATADELLTQTYLPRLTFHRLDVMQRAVVTQVTDRSGSINFWTERLKEERENLLAPEYDPGNNDLSRLIAVLNNWAQAGELPLLVGHKALCDFVRQHPGLIKIVKVAHFQALRGSNAYEQCSVVFITGRNQPPHAGIYRQARSIFGNDGTALPSERLDNLPTEQFDYWLSSRSNHQPSAISLPSFADPRVAAVQRQSREAETVQAIARLRLVWSNYQKRVFLFSNLPIEMPIDHLVEFNELLPNTLVLELLQKGSVPLSGLGLLKICPYLGLSRAAAKKVLQRARASEPQRMLQSLPDLLKPTAQIAIFKAGDKRKSAHSHLFLPSNYSGDPISAAFFTPWTPADAVSHLEDKGWGAGAISDLKIRYVYEGANNA